MFTKAWRWRSFSLQVFPGALPSIKPQPPLNARWLGLFQDRTEALAAAEKLRKEDTDVCGICKP